MPEYCIPNVITRVDRFPLNANGKVDRKRLAEDKTVTHADTLSGQSSNAVVTIWEDSWDAGDRLGRKPV